MPPNSTTGDEGRSTRGRVAFAILGAAAIAFAVLVAGLVTSRAVAPLEIARIRPRTERETSRLDRHVVFDVAAGDVDGDGRADLLVSSPEDGRVEILRGPFPREESGRPAPAVVILGGAGAGFSPSGSSILVADLDGRAGAEVAIGNSTARRVLVFRDLPLGGGRVLREEDAERVFASTSFDVGVSLAASPARPGFAAELAIGGTTETSSRVHCVEYGSGRGERIVDLDAGAGSRRLGQRGERGVREHFGWDLEYADFDGDAAPDLVVSSAASPGDDGAPAAGEVNVIALGLADSHGRTLAWIRGGAPHDRFGRRLAVADFDGDGVPDLVASSTHARVEIAGSGAPEKNVGEVYLYPGSRLLADTAHAARESAARILHGFEREERFGWVVLPADFDGDGAVDLLVTAKHAGGAARAGRAVFVRNALLFDARSWAEAAADARVVPPPARFRHFGLAGATADFDGDGCADAALAGIEFDDAGAVEGRVVVVYGSRDFFSRGAAPATRVLR